MKLQALLISSRSNFVQYNGNYYSTLADVGVDSSSRVCQSNYLTLPDNWVIASNDANSRTVIGAHYWSADCVAAASSTSYNTKYWSNSAGTDCGASGVTASWTTGSQQLAVGNCGWKRQILIMCKYPRKLRWLLKISPTFQ